MKTWKENMATDLKGKTVSWKKRNAKTFTHSNLQIAEINVVESIY